MSRHRGWRAALVVGWLTVLSGCVVAPGPAYVEKPMSGAIVVPGPPPPLPVVVVPPAPAMGMAWVPGAWVWRGQWIWWPGRWVYPPHPYAYWAPGRWRHRDGHWFWGQGHWRRR
ncbi:hypothetical protein ACSDBR_02670 [Acidithiobacillus ferriphilus]|uniref:hypothetical protein n=1 Tax=Acidithiobacillus ferriphilus TaxID=1689834 RepID=UPI00390C65C7